MHKKREKCFENKNKISLLKNKSGQVTIFIIIGIVIVVFAVLLYVLPKDKIKFGNSGIHPPVVYTILR
jgi:hypothetical protein